MKIGILGSGLMGAKLGTLFARCGHEVVFSYSRSRKKLEQLAKKAGSNATAGTPKEAAAGADAVLLAVHWTQIDDVFKQTGDIAGKIVVSCCLPMNVANSELVIAHNSSGGEELAKKFPKAHVVLAFNTIPSEVLFGVYETKDKAQRPSLVYCGDHKGAKKVAAQLISDVGFEPVDLGSMDKARLSEPFALLIGHLAYEGINGPELAYRFERY